MINYAKLIRYWQSFSEEIGGLKHTTHGECAFDPVCSSAEVDKIAIRWPHGLPTPLRSLWTRGSRRSMFRYCLNFAALDLGEFHKIFPTRDRLHGLLNFQDAEDIYPYPSDWAQLFSSGRTDAERKNFEYWSLSAVFMWLPNGDALGLLPQASTKNASVVYLDHDGTDATSCIAESFEEFLRHWHHLRYIFPDYEFLDPWIDPSSGLLNSETPLTNVLQSLYPPQPPFDAFVDAI